MSSINKKYIFNGVLGIAQFIIITSVAIYHFLINSIAFSQLVSFCVFSLILGYFSLEVAIKNRSFKYMKHKYLNARFITFLLIVNLLVSLIIAL